MAISTQCFPLWGGGCPSFQLRAKKVGPLDDLRAPIRLAVAGSPPAMLPSRVHCLHATHLKSICHAPPPKARQKVFSSPTGRRLFRGPSIPTPFRKTEKGPSVCASCRSGFHLASPASFLPATFDPANSFASNVPHLPVIEQTSAIWTDGRRRSSTKRSVQPIGCHHWLVSPLASQCQTGL